MTESEAKRIRDQYKVQANSVQSNLRGTKGPYFWDSTAFIAVYHKISYEMNQKNKEINELKKQYLI